MSVLSIHRKNALVTLNIQTLTTCIIPSQHTLTRIIPSHTNHTYTYTHTHTHRP